jgi:hypothetical protein
MTPIEVLAHFENGTPHPIRFKLADKTLKIEQVISVTEEKIAGNRMLCFRCQSEIGGELKPFEIKFELEVLASGFCIRCRKRRSLNAPCWFFLMSF